MLISRCAWHRRYHGYTKILGISSWQGLQPSFTDGICQKCAARVRADHLRARYDRGASADRREHAWAPGLAAVSLAIMVSLVLIARPTHELPPLPRAVAILPPAAVESAAVEPAAVDAPSGQELATTEPARPNVRMRVASAPSAPRPIARRPSVASTGATWLPGTLARVTVPVSWGSAPYRVVAPRDIAQSP